jgi:hypothetical protein
MGLEGTHDRPGSTIPNRGRWTSLSGVCNPGFAVFYPGRHSGQGSNPAALAAVADLKSITFHCPDPRIT